ncbi:hypothetical protein [Nisaea sp.]|uniref:hypothetical protein n=1 Tax=Nisaea sp. TaxID=2024842 RepID=UPI0032EA9C1B
MNVEELERKIGELMDAASSLTGPERVLKRIEIRNLENDIDGLANADILDRLNRMELPHLETIDQKIQAAKDATAAEARRADAIGTAIGIIRTGLGLVL